MKIENILNEKEVTEVRKFLANPTMKEAVKKILLADIWTHGTLNPGQESDWKRNFALNLIIGPEGTEFDQTNEHLGERLKACMQGLIFLENGFSRLDSFEKIEANEEGKENPAR